MGDTYTMKIGFPFIYYRQFQLSGSPFLNTEWNVKMLIFDVFIYWVFITGLFLYYKKRTSVLK